MKDWKKQFVKLFKHGDYVDERGDEWVVDGNIDLESFINKLRGDIFEIRFISEDRNIGIMEVTDGYIKSCYKREIKNEREQAKIEERIKIASMKPALRDLYLFPENAGDL